MTPPEHLNEIAKAEWQFLVPNLQRLGLLDGIDKTTLELYCSAYARWRDGEVLCSKYGEYMTNKDKTYVQVSAFFSIRNTAYDQCRKMLHDMGITPSQRNKMTNEPESNEEPVQWWESAKMSG